jgi:hypothetical protein
MPPTPESDITSHSPHSSPHMSCDIPPPSSSPQDGQNEPPPDAPPAKRKAGRKPLYKTAQERRERNRRAQLQFRARRSDYLAQLEETCRHYEVVVKELQESNKMAHDALRRETARVKQLEAILRQVFSTSPQQMRHPLSHQQQAPPLAQHNPMQLPLSTFSPDTSPLGTMIPSPPPQSHQLFRVSIPKRHSLLSLEQQMSSSSAQSHATPFYTPESYLGKPPLTRHLNYRS